MSGSTLCNGLAAEKKTPFLQSSPEFTKNQPSQEKEPVYILSDCVAAIDILCKQSNIQFRLEKLRQIWTRIHEVNTNGYSLHLIWCPGHCNIRYNDMADESAKSAAERLSTEIDIDDDSRKMDFETIKKLIR